MGCPRACFILLFLLPCLLLLPFCSSKAFNSYIGTIVCAPSPHGSESPPNTTTTTITAALPKNKRESVRHHPLDLFHTRAPTSVPDGVAFFQGFLSTPRVLQNGRPPPPSGAHYSAAPHPPAPPPRAHGQGTSPLYPTPVGSPIKIINHTSSFFF